MSNCNRKGVDNAVLSNLLQEQTFLKPTELKFWCNLLLTFRLFVRRRRRHVAEAGQRHRQGPLWWPRRCVPVRYAGGTSAASARREARLPPQPAAGLIPADGQQARHEALWLEEGADEGADQAESGRPLGHPSVQ